MPLVPIFNGDVATSFLGVMRFPDDLNKARLYASWRLAKVTQSNDAALLVRVAKEAAEFAPHYCECGKVEVAGSAVGAITSAMVRLVHCHPNIATWERAINIVRNNDGGLPSGRPLLQVYRRQMNKVAHFWAAFYDRGIKFGDVQAFGDGQEFSARAEIIRQIIFKFEIERANATNTEEKIRSEYADAFHADVPDRAGALVNISPIPGALWKVPTAKRAQKSPSEKKRTPRSSR
jgi:hypothetical protein